MIPKSRPSRDINKHPTDPEQYF